MLFNVSILPTFISPKFFGSGFVKVFPHQSFQFYGRGFDIAESVGAMKALLNIPAFTKGKNQLSALEMEETRTIANVRIHVERVIGNVRQKYPILQNTLPIHFVHKRDGEDTPL